MKGAAIGSLSALGLSGSASAVEDVDADTVASILASRQVRAIQQADPDLQLQPDGARALGRETDAEAAQVDDSGQLSGLIAVSIPANHGTLLVSDTGTHRQAVLYFEDYVADLDVDWPRKTEARLKATGDEAVFQRTATRGEAARLLATIGRWDLLRSDDVIVGIEPETGEYAVTYLNEDEQQIEEIRASDAPGPGSDVTVTNRSTYSADGSAPVQPESSETVVSAQSCDCNDEAADLLYCVYQAQACLGCFIFGIPAPPVAAACIIFVCVGGTGGILLTFIANLGCTDVDAGCVQDCAQSVW